MAVNKGTRGADNKNTLGKASIDFDTLPWQYTLDKAYWFWYSTGKLMSIATEGSPKMMVGNF